MPVPLKRRAALVTSCSDAGELPLITLDLVESGGGCLTTDELPITPKPAAGAALVQPGDVLYGKLRPYLAKSLLVIAPAYASTELLALRPTAHLEPRFLAYVLRARPYVEWTVATSEGTKMPRTSWEKAGSFVIDDLPLQRQRGIADFLDTETARLDALITKKRQMVKLLWSRFDVAVGRVTRADLTVALKDGDNAIPAGWRRMKLARCFSQVDYGIGEGSTAAGEIAVLGMGNVNDRGAVVLPPNGYVDSVDDKMLLSTDDLLYNRTNSLSKVGKVALVETLPGPTTFASYLVRLRVSPLADERYLRHFLNSEALLGLARSTALPSIGQANLNPARYGALDVVVPPVDEQRVIASRLDEQMRRTAHATDRLDEQIVLLQEHRQALITAAVTGELEVPGVAA